MENITPNKSQKQRRALRKSTLLAVVLTIAIIAIIVSQTFGQTSTTDSCAIDSNKLRERPEPGMFGATISSEISGIDGGGCNLDLFAKANIYSRPDRKGFNTWMLGNMQVSNRTDKIFGE